MTGEQAPEGIWLVAASGQMIPCRPLRDPELDHDGCAAWLAVPLHPVPPGSGPWVLRAAMLPGRTHLHLCMSDLTSGGEGNE
jgi:hypothetical protein